MKNSNANSDHEVTNDTNHPEYLDLVRFALSVMITRPNEIDPIILHIYIVKLGCTWIYIIFFLFLL